MAVRLRMAIFCPDFRDGRRKLRLHCPGGPSQRISGGIAGG